MWPEIGDAVNRTVQAEAALNDVYALALTRWSPSLEAAVLPTLTASGQLPPDPAAVAETQQVWDQLTQELILVGLSMVWAMSFDEASDSLSTVPALVVAAQLLSSRDVDPDVVRIVAAASGAEPAEVLKVYSSVRADSRLAATMDDFVETQRAVAQAVPAQVQLAIESAVRDATPAAITEGMSADTVTADIRLAVRDVVVPTSFEMRDAARLASYQAAGVQNHAVVSAAAGSSEPLEKCWISTIDGKTRPTHWAADGQRVPLDGHFTIGGEPLRFPGDPLGTAAEVKNCRCRVGVLAPDEALPDEVDRHTERLNGRDSVQVNREGSQADEIDRRRRAGNVRARDDRDGIGRTASASPTGGTTMAEDDTTSENMYRTFTHQPIAFFGTPTSDGRILGSEMEMAMRPFPQPVMWCEQSVGGHSESFTVGVLESAVREGDTLFGDGYMLNSEAADRCCEQLAHGVSSPSVDLAGAKWKATDEKQNELPEEAFYDEDVEVFITITESELMGVTLVATAAFGATKLELDPERSERDVTLVASAQQKFAPLVFDPALFADPKLSGPTRLTMTEDGHIFGHIACFGQCHRSIQAECIFAPRSRTGYAQFHTSPPVHLSDGNMLQVGRLTVATGHAPDHLAAGPAAAHYDNTGACFALGRAGEDEFGVWFSGIAAPWADEATVQQGIMAPLSGDWRNFGGNLELVAALAVNTPGFVASAVGREDDRGMPLTLVASLAPRAEEQAGEPLTLEQIRTAVRETVVEALAVGTAQRQAAAAASPDRTAELVARATGQAPVDRTAALLARA